MADSPIAESKDDDKQATNATCTKLPLNSLQHYVDVVQWRWLLAEEVHDVLTNHCALGYVKPKRSPPSAAGSGVAFRWSRQSARRKTASALYYIA